MSLAYLYPHLLVLSIFIVNVANEKSASVSACPFTDLQTSPNHLRQFPYIRESAV